MKLWLLLLILLAPGCSPIGCGGSVPRMPSMTPDSPKGRPALAGRTSNDVKQDLDDKAKQVAALQRDLDAAQADLKALTAEKERVEKQERIDRIRRFSLWASALAGFGLVASVVAFFFLGGRIPGMGKLCLSGAASALAVLALAQFVSWLAPWLMLIGLVLTGLGIIAFIVYFWLHSKHSDAVLNLYERIKPHIDLSQEDRKKIQVEVMGKSSKWIDYARKRLGHSVGAS